MKLNQNDISILRSLATRYAELAALPEQKTRMERWYRHNALESERPLFLCDQLPWNELDPDCARGDLISDSYWNGIALTLKRTIYKFENLKTDMVIDPYIMIPYRIENTGWGLDSRVKRLRLDEHGSVDSQHMECMINEPEDIEKIKIPQLTLLKDLDKETEETAHFLFDGIIPFRRSGIIMHLGAWDTIAYWMGVENCYIELMDRPEMIHQLMERMTEGYLSMIEQLNAQGLYDSCDHICHCSQTYRRDDPAERHGVSNEGWAFGLAQLFTSVSPKITEEFECAYMKRIFPHFKNIYYGCCDRLDDRMEYVSALPNVRKLSCSPWSNREAFAEKMPATIIMSNKPSPAFLAGDSFDEDVVRKDIRRTVDAARKNGKKLEMILKDVSTVRYDPARLRRYSEIATEEAEKY